MKSRNLEEHSAYDLSALISTGEIGKITESNHENPKNTKVRKGIKRLRLGDLIPREVNLGQPKGLTKRTGSSRCQRSPKWIVKTPP